MTRSWRPWHSGTSRERLALTACKRQHNNTDTWYTTKWASDLWVNKINACKELVLLQGTAHSVSSPAWPFLFCHNLCQSSWTQLPLSPATEVVLMCNTTQHKGGGYHCLSMLQPSTHNVKDKWFKLKVSVSILHTLFTLPILCAHISLDGIESKYF